MVPPAGPPLLVPLHGLGSRHDLPLPFPVVVAGAAVVLVATFAMLAAGWRRPRFVDAAGRPRDRKSVV